MFKDSELAIGSAECIFDMRCSPLIDATLSETGIKTLGNYPRNSSFQNTVLLTITLLQ